MRQSRYSNSCPRRWLELLGLLACMPAAAAAVTSAKRAASLPEVPTVAESGMPGYEVLNWFGVAAPARTPQAIVTRLNAAIVKSLQLPEVREKLTGEGSEVAGSSPAQFAQFLERDLVKWAQIVKAAGIKANDS